MTLPRIHFIAPAGSCRRFFDALGIADGAGFVRHVQKLVGPEYVVSANYSLLDAQEDDDHGGRTDDADRAADIQSALGDDNVAAIIAIRGGAWLTRILPRIDFDALKRRSSRIAVFGFSELTTLLNIVAAYPMAFAVHDMGPAFLMYGMKRHARLRAIAEQRAASSATVANENQKDGNACAADLAIEEQARAWMSARLADEFANYIADSVQMIRGAPSGRLCRAKHVYGPHPAEGEIELVGGNLTVLATLLGSRWRETAVPNGRWLMLEDLREKVERIDRLLAQMTLCWAWKNCGGILLGDFHLEDRCITPAVVELLRYHLPEDSSIPILVTEDVGHVWPMAPLPLNRAVALRRGDGESYRLEPRWS